MASWTKAAEPPPTRRGGRPSREQAALLGDRILDAATDLFLAEGYGATSIEAVAQRARISKRTFYHRFPDKAALFDAVLRRIIQGIRPPPDVPLFEGSDLSEMLRRLARLAVHASVAPMTLALTRLMLTEAQRFPELAAIVAREGSRGEAVRQITAILERESQRRPACDRPPGIRRRAIPFSPDDRAAAPRPRPRDADDRSRTRLLG